MTARFLLFAGVLGAAGVAGCVGYIFGSGAAADRERSSARGDIVRLETSLKKSESEADRLRKEVQILRRLAAPADLPDAGGGLPARPTAEGADPSLVAKGRSALASGEARSFADMLLGALAQGGKGYGAAFALIEEFRKNPVPGVVEALLPELGTRLRETLAESPGDGLGIAHMIARIGGPDALGTLWSASEEQESGVRYHLIGILSGVEGGEAREFLLARLEDAPDRIARQAILAGLARRGDTLADMAILLSPGSSPEDRMAISGGLVWSCQESPENRERLWEAARSAPPGVQEAYLAALARAGDGRAQDQMLAELRAGRPGEMPPEAWASFQADRLRRNLDVFEQTARDDRLPFQVRLGAAQAVSRVDRGGAVRALMGNFGAQPDSGRLQTVYALRSLGTREAAEELARIGGSDPSETVRNAAR